MVNASKGSLQIEQEMVPASFFEGSTGLGRLIIVVIRGPRAQLAPAPRHPSPSKAVILLAAEHFLQSVSALRIPCEGKGQPGVVTGDELILILRVVVRVTVKILAQVQAQRGVIIGPI